MRIATNKINSIIDFFKSELKSIYTEEEIKNLIFYSFNHLVNFSRIDLITKQENRVSESELLKFNNVVKELKKQKPIQYILGNTDFYGLRFNVNESVLIPRQETEELIDWIIKEYSFIKSILDIGTGSGNIPISLKKNIPTSVVFSIDISESAINIAKENAKLNDVEINFILKDIRDSENTNDLGLFDIIVSNPPYVCESEKKLMQKNVLDFEPHSALFVEDNEPLIFYDKISNFAMDHLSKNGLLFFEINECFGIDVSNMLENKGFTEIELKKDLNNKDRFIKGKKV